MEIALVPSAELPAGAALLPPGLPGGGAASLRLGASTAAVRPLGAAPAGRLVLAADLWDRLALPFAGIRLQVRRTSPDQVELGPAVAVVYAGAASALRLDKAVERASLCYAHLMGAPGLFALGFDESIDWDAGTMEGYVVDNRAGSPGAVRSARFPIPAAVRLSFSIRHRVVEQLRDRTENRTFNWVRGLDKYQFYTLIAAEPDLRDHLPETRPVTGPADLAAMLARHGTVFVKHVLGSRGKDVARIRPLRGGLEVCHIARGQMARAELPDLESAMAYLRPVVGRGRWIVQQGVDTVGRRGRSAHFRITLVRDGHGQWQCPATEALVAPDSELAFTNLANGAETEAVADHLAAHHGLSPAAARQCEQEMIDLSMRVARCLSDPLHPLGILGVDVAREAASGKLWLFEANTVPGWGYPLPVEQAMARSLTDYALLLSGWTVQAEV